MSSFSARVFRGFGSLLAPASRTSSSATAASSKRPSTAGTKKPTAKTKTKTKSKSNPKPKAKPASPETPRTTGIFKVSPVSPALAQFLGSGEASRTDALKQLWIYIKSRDLQNPTNKREILCDEKLKHLFEGKDKVGFLEIGKLLNHHFVKTT